jgi:tetratricopeptide (TPR) repeat protein
MVLRWLITLLLALPISAIDIESLWDGVGPAEAEQRLRHAMTVHADDKDLTARLLLQIAKAQGQQAQFANASLTLDQVQGMLPTLSPALSVAYLIERGRLDQTEGDGQRAWRWYRGAALLAEQQHLDEQAIDALQMQASTLKGKAALSQYLKAQDLAERSDAPDAVDWQGTLYSNIGWLYYDLNDKQQALVYLRKAQAWHEQHGTEKSLLVARWSVARMRRLAGEPDKALPIQLDLERAWKRLGQDDGYVDEEIAECLLSLGRNDDAQPYFARAYAVLSRDAWLVDHDAGRLDRLHRLSQ